MTTRQAPPVSRRVARWPRGAGLRQLVLLLAGAGMARALDSEHAWYWTSRWTVIVRTVFRKPARAIFRLFGSCLIEISLGDDYWMPSIMHEYEPEILAILSKALTPDSVFIDAGANIGWWSLFASTVVVDPSHVIAIEPAASTFRDLRRNASLNGGAYMCLRAAVWRSAGERLQLRSDSGSRESAHIEGGSPLWSRPAAHVETVLSVSLNEVIRSQTGTAAQVIVKLDVEGAELQALEGAGRSLKDVDLLIYEDHGKDPAAVVTGEMLRLGFEVFSADRRGRLQAIRSSTDAAKIKRSAKIGYNFFAVRPGSAVAGRLGLSPARSGAAFR